MKLSNKTIINFELLLIFIVIVLLYKISQNNQNLYNASQNRILMLQTADRLRHSSDDLTHFARTYVVSADEKFKQQYFDTLAIRNGEKLRPDNYNSIYWDLNKDVRNIHHKDTRILSLDDIFKSLPYDKQEIEKLKLSKDNSDDLVNLEIEAFNSMQGKFRDKNNSYSILKKSNQKYAIELLHSKKYYLAKHKIMKPIDEFILLVDKRTTSKINQINSNSKPLLYLLLISIFLFLLGNYFILKFLNNADKKELEDKKVLLNIQNELNKELMQKNKIASDLNRELEESEHELEEINKNLQNTIEKEVEKNTLIQKQLFKSEKMASMGEMIGNIAHQWRQPLSAITTSATSIQLQKDMGNLDGDILNKMCDSITRNTQYLSKTIDDFRDYVKGDNPKEIFYLNEKINSSLHLLDSSFGKNNIKIVVNLEENITINGYGNTLLQCFLNILNNGIDALIQNDIDNKLIFIFTKVIDNEICIEIKDNARGISKGIIDNIFEVYFTTKHKSQGTGLGLNMVYKFIVDEMNGKIEVKNDTYIYNDVEYTGASFRIKLKTII